MVSFHMNKNHDYRFGIDADPAIVLPFGSQIPFSSIPPGGDGSSSSSEMSDGYSSSSQEGVAEELMSELPPREEEVDSSEIIEGFVTSFYRNLEELSEDTRNQSSSKEYQSEVIKFLHESQVDGLDDVK